MENFAEIAYQEVPTQEELFNGGKSLHQEKLSSHPKPKNDQTTQKLDEQLDEAAQ